MMEMHEAAERIGGMFEAIAGDGQTALASLGLAEGARVLDVGTGNGNFAIVLALNGFEVTTGEPETDTTHYAGKDWEANAGKVGAKDRIAFLPFDASKMPFDDGAYDAVFFFGVLHHVDEALRRDVLREAMRVVKPGGAVTFFEPRPEILPKVRIKDPTHPDPANPDDYAGSLAGTAKHIEGKMMNITIYTAAVEAVG